MQVGCTPDQPPVGVHVRMRSPELVYPGLQRYVTTEPGSTPPNVFVASLTSSGSEQVITAIVKQILRDVNKTIVNPASTVM